FDKLRNAEVELTSMVMDAILEATGVIRGMFGELAQAVQPAAFDGALAERLSLAIEGRLGAGKVGESAEVVASEIAGQEHEGGPDWAALHAAVAGAASIADDASATSQEISLAAEHDDKPQERQVSD